MENLTPLLQALVGLAAAAVTTYLIPYIRSRTSAEKLERIRAWVEIGVKAAEQMYGGSGRGGEKRAYVRALLDCHGLAADDGELDALTEAAVNDLNSRRNSPAETEDSPCKS